jgi:hypothetical protein
MLSSSGYKVASFLLFNGGWHSLFLLNYCNIITLSGNNLIVNIKTESKNEKNTYKYVLNPFKNEYFLALANLMYGCIQKISHSLLRLSLKSFFGPLVYGFNINI